MAQQQAPQTIVDAHTGETVPEGQIVYWHNRAPELKPSTVPQPQVLGANKLFPKGRQNVDLKPAYERGSLLMKNRIKSLAHILPYPAVKDTSYRLLWELEYISKSAGQSPKAKTVFPLEWEEAAARNDIGNLYKRFSPQMLLLTSALEKDLKDWVIVAQLYANTKAQQELLDNFFKAVSLTDGQSLTKPGKASVTVTDRFGIEQTFTSTTPWWVDGNRSRPRYPASLVTVGPRGQPEDETKTPMLGIDDGQGGIKMVRRPANPIIGSPFDPKKRFGVAVDDTGDAFYICSGLPVNSQGSWSDVADANVADPRPYRFNTKFNEGVWQALMGPNGITAAKALWYDIQTGSAWLDRSFYEVVDKAIRQLSKDAWPGIKDLLDAIRLDKNQSPSSWLKTNDDSTYQMVQQMFQLQYQYNAVHWDEQLNVPTNLKNESAWRRFLDKNLFNTEVLNLPNTVFGFKIGQNRVNYLGTTFTQEDVDNLVAELEALENLSARQQQGRNTLVEFLEDLSNKMEAIDQNPPYQEDPIWIQYENITETLRNWYRTDLESIIAAASAVTQYGGQNVTREQAIVSQQVNAAFETISKGEQIDLTQAKVQINSIADKSALLLTEQKQRIEDFKALEAVVFAQLKRRNDHETAVENLENLLSQKQLANIVPEAQKIDLQDLNPLKQGLTEALRLYLERPETLEEWVSSAKSFNIEEIKDNLVYTNDPEFEQRVGLQKLKGYIDQFEKYRSFNAYETLGQKIRGVYRAIIHSAKTSIPDDTPSVLLDNAIREYTTAKKSYSKQYDLFTTITVKLLLEEQKRVVDEFERLQKERLKNMEKKNMALAESKLAQITTTQANDNTEVYQSIQASRAAEDLEKAAKKQNDSADLAEKQEQEGSYGTWPEIIGEKNDYVNNATVDDLANRLKDFRDQTGKIDTTLGEVVQTGNDTDVSKIWDSLKGILLVLGRVYDQMSLRQRAHVIEPMLGIGMLNKTTGKVRTQLQKVNMDIFTGNTVREDFQALAKEDEVPMLLWEYNKNAYIFKGTFEPYQKRVDAVAKTFMLLIARPASDALYDGSSEAYNALRTQADAYAKEEIKKQLALPNKTSFGLFSGNATRITPGYADTVTAKQNVGSQALADSDSVSELVSQMVELKQRSAVSSTQLLMRIALNGSSLATKWRNNYPNAQTEFKQYPIKDIVETVSSTDNNISFSQGIALSQLAALLYVEANYGSVSKLQASDKWEQLYDSVRSRDTVQYATEVATLDKTQTFDGAFAYFKDTQRGQRLLTTAPEDVKSILQGLGAGKTWYLRSELPDTLLDKSYYVPSLARTVESKWLQNYENALRLWLQSERQGTLPRQRINLLKRAEADAKGLQGTTLTLAMSQLQNTIQAAKEVAKKEAADINNAKGKNDALRTLYDLVNGAEYSVEVLLAQKFKLNDYIRPVQITREEWSDYMTKAWGYRNIFGDNDLSEMRPLKLGDTRGDQKYYVLPTNAIVENAATPFAEEVWLPLLRASLVALATSRGVELSDSSLVKDIDTAAQTWENLRDMEFQRIKAVQVLDGQTLSDRTIFTSLFNAIVKARKDASPITELLTGLGLADYGDGELRMPNVVSVKERGLSREYVVPDDDSKSDYFQLLSTILTTGWAAAYYKDKPSTDLLEQQKKNFLAQRDLKRNPPSVAEADKPAVIKTNEGVQAIYDALEKVPAVEPPFTDFINNWNSWVVPRLNALYLADLARAAVRKCMDRNNFPGWSNGAFGVLDEAEYPTVQAAEEAIENAKNGLLCWVGRNPDIIAKEQQAKQQEELQRLEDKGKEEEEQAEEQDNIEDQKAEEKSQEEQRELDRQKKAAEVLRLQTQRAETIQEPGRIQPIQNIEGLTGQKILGDLKSQAAKLGTKWRNAYKNLALNAASNLDSSALTIEMQNLDFAKDETAILKLNRHIRHFRKWLLTASVKGADAKKSVKNIKAYKGVLPESALGAMLPAFAALDFYRNLNMTDTYPPGLKETKPLDNRSLSTDIELVKVQTGLALQEKRQSALRKGDPAIQWPTTSSNSNITAGLTRLRDAFLDAIYMVTNAMNAAGGISRQDDPAAMEEAFDKFKELRAKLINMGTRVGLDTLVDEVNENTLLSHALRYALQRPELAPKILSKISASDIDAIMAGRYSGDFDRIASILESAAKEEDNSCQDSMEWPEMDDDWE